MVDKLIILWVDSDPYVENTAGILKNAGFSLKFFNETQDLIDYYYNHGESQIHCIITSMMERGGRKEKGLKNAFEMIGEIRAAWRASYSPLITMITCSADEQACKDNGFDIIVYGNREKMQKIVKERLKKDSSCYYKTRWREPNLLPCLDLRILAKQFLETLEINSSDMDPFVDRCFCKNCEPKLVWYRGVPQEKYVLPRGWYRYGIKIRKEYVGNQHKVCDWHVAYHGASTEVVKSIVEHKRIMFPGDKLNNGTTLQVKHGQCFAEQFGGRPVVYLSPSIKYSSDDVYAKPKYFKGKTIKTVIQCRIKPGSYRKNKETLGGRSNDNENFSSNELEWVTDDKTAVVPYGFLIGVF